jgi:hypothetical protein
MVNKGSASSHPSTHAAPAPPSVSKPTIPHSTIPVAKPSIPQTVVAKAPVHAPVPPPPRAALAPANVPHPPPPPHSTHPPPPPAPHSSSSSGMLAGVGTALATGVAMGTGQAIANRAIDAALGPQKYEVVTELRGNCVLNKSQPFFILVYLCSANSDVALQTQPWTSITLLSRPLFWRPEPWEFKLFELVA